MCFRYICIYKAKTGRKVGTMVGGIFSERGLDGLSILTGVLVGCV